MFCSILNVGIYTCGLFKKKSLPKFSQAATEIKWWYNWSLSHFVSINSGMLQLHVNTNPFDTSTQELCCPTFRSQVSFKVSLERSCLAARMGAKLNKGCQSIYVVYPTNCAVFCWGFGGFFFVISSVLVDLGWCIYPDFNIDILCFYYDLNIIKCLERN